MALPGIHLGMPVELHQIFASLQLGFTSRSGEVITARTQDARSAMTHLSDLHHAFQVSAGVVNPVPRLPLYNPGRRPQPLRPTDLPPEPDLVTWFDVMSGGVDIPQTHHGQLYAFQQPLHQTSIGTILGNVRPESRPYVVGLRHLQVAIVFNMRRLESVRLLSLISLHVGGPNLDNRRVGMYRRLLTTLPAMTTGALMAQIPRSHNGAFIPPNIHVPIVSQELLPMIKALQNTSAVSLFIACYTRLVSTLVNNTSLGVRLTFNITSANVTTQTNSFRTLEYPQVGVPPIVFTSQDTTRTIADKLKHDLIQFANSVTGTHNADVVGSGYVGDMITGVLLTSISLVLVQDGAAPMALSNAGNLLLANSRFTPNLNNPSPFDALSEALKVIITSTVAYGASNQVMKVLREVSCDNFQPREFRPSARHHCVVRTMAYLYYHRKVMSEKVRQHSMQVYEDWFRALAPDHYTRDGDVHGIITFCLERYEQPQSLTFVVLDRAMRHLVCNPVFISAVFMEERFESIDYTEMEEQQLLPEMTVMVYYLGHVFPAKWMTVVQLMRSNGGREERIDQRAQECLEQTETYTLTMAQLRKERPLAELSLSCYGLQSEQGQFGPSTTMAYDLETMQCTYCKKSESLTPVHAYCAGLVWNLPEGGLGRNARTELDGTGDYVTFIGSECPFRYQADPSYRGCITQMLDWLYDHGFMTDKRKKNQREVRLSAFNGAHFDAFFITEALTYNNLPYDLVQLGSSLVSVTCMNLVFTDFRLIYPLGTLQKVFDTLTGACCQSPSLDLCYKSESLTVHRPPKGKWSVFPYLLFDYLSPPTQESDTYDLRPFTVKNSSSTNQSTSQMYARDIWGLTKTVRCSQCQSTDPFHILTEDILGAHGQPRWILTAADIQEYCVHDCRILFYALAVHYNFYAQGGGELESNVRRYDSYAALTGASASLLTFRQGYLKHDIVATDPQFDTGLTYHPHDFRICSRSQVKETPALTTWTRASDDSTPYPVFALLQSAYYGGITSNFVVEPPLRVTDPVTNEIHQRDIYVYDRNSSYPSEMLKDLPTRIIERRDAANLRTGEDWSATISHPDYKDYHLFHCKVVYPPNVSGLIVRVGGMCVAPSTIEASWFDPLNRRTEHHVRFGIELEAAVRDGAKVTVYRTYIMEAEPFMAEYITCLYRSRLIFGKAKDPDNPELSLPNRRPDKGADAHYKNLMNFASGKFGQQRHPAHRLYYSLADLNMEDCNNKLVGIGKKGPNNAMLLEFFDGKTAQIGQLACVIAKITAGARANLMDAIRAWDGRVFYVDTDSVHVGGALECDSHEQQRFQEFKDAFVDNYRLGCWKMESRCQRGMYICKKMYLEHDFYDDKGELSNEPASIHSKGVPIRKLCPDDFVKLARCETVTVPMDPSYCGKLNGDCYMGYLPSWTRTIQMRNVSRIMSAAGDASIPHPSQDAVVTAIKLAYQPPK